METKKGRKSGEVINSLDNDRVKEQLNRILLSPDFKATQRQKKFLSYIVETFLEGRETDIKGYSIAIEVFGRESFDQAKDPIVSIEARRLRRALAFYYSSSGMYDEVLITIPKGSYAPAIHVQSEGIALKNNSEEIERDVLYEKSRPTILIRPLTNLSPEDSLYFIEEGFKAELAVELSRYQDLLVLVKPTGVDAQSTTEPNARFIIEGYVRSDKEKIKLTIHLLDKKLSRLLWGDSFYFTLKGGDLISFQETLARNIAATIAEEHGYISQTIAQESNHKAPNELKTYEAILKFYMHEATFSSESFHAAYDALEQASVTEPDCAQVWSFLGRLNAENYCTDHYDKDTSIEKAVEYSEKAVELNPNNQRSRAGLAFALMQYNMRSEGLQEIRRAVELNPNSLVYLDVIGHTMALLGDWDLGCSLIRKSIKMNPYHRPYIYHVLFLDWFLKENYENAYLETLNFKLPPVYWESVFRAVSLAELQRENEAKAAIDTLLKLKPNFTTCGKELMQRVVKSEKIIKSLIAGLGKAGLEVF